ncbi:fibronectin type III domain-containing protein [Sphaerisporangium sp. NPDC051017]|uniref:fibronectin type III domain-containing protein n=1 Tax=Sphaerisporangium sp. NPDC051017 TaxID=3154636 RepID=UPI003441B603
MRVLRGALLALTAVAALLSGSSGTIAHAGSIQPPGYLRTEVWSPEQITIFWSTVDKAEQYVLLRSLTPGGPYAEVRRTDANGTSDTGLRPDTTYYYVVQSVRGNQTSPYSAEVSGTTLKLPLLPPTQLRAQTLSTSEITLTWDVGTNATGYRLLRATTAGGPYTLVHTGTSLSHTDTGLESGTTYRYVVQSTDETRVSENSPEASATTVAVTLTAPRDFKVNADGTGLAMTWDAVPGAVRYDVIHLTLPDDREVVLGSTTGTSFTYPASAYFWYRLKVRAVAGGTKVDSPIVYVANGARTLTTLSVSPNPNLVGSVRLTATVEAIGQSGLSFSGEYVEFFMDGLHLGRDLLPGSHQIVYATAALPPGEHAFYAQYQGEDLLELGASASATVTHLVQ